MCGGMGESGSLYYCIVKPGMLFYIVLTPISTISGL